LLSTRELRATDVISFEPLEVGRQVHAQIRAHGEAVPARILEVPATSSAPGATAPTPAKDAGDGSLRVELSTPIRGVAPGQTLVLYDADRVLAAATLERRACRRCSPSPGTGPSGPPRPRSPSASSCPRTRTWRP